jgi:hypothetical protein
MADGKWPMAKMQHATRAWGEWQMATSFAKASEVRGFKFATRSVLQVLGRRMADGNGRICVEMSRTTVPGS